MQHYNHFMSVEAEDKENKRVLSEISQDTLNRDQRMKEKELKGLKESLLKMAEGDQIFKSEEKSVKNQKYPASMDLEEPLCIESKNRFVLFPIANQEV